MKTSIEMIKKAHAAMIGDAIACGVAPTAMPIPSLKCPDSRRREVGIVFVMAAIVDHDMGGRSEF
jgi:hypothetical protein